MNYRPFTEVNLMYFLPCERVVGGGVTHGANCVCLKHEAKQASKKQCVRSDEDDAICTGCGELSFEPYDPLNCGNHNSKD